MLTEDDAPRPRLRFTPLPLDRLGVDELRAYIGELQAEVARAEGEIARKQQHLNAADSLFKRP